MHDPSQRRAGLAILQIGGLFGLAISAMHRTGAGYPRLARAPGGFAFVWTLFALGTTSLVSLVLAAMALRGAPHTRRD